MTSFGQAWEAWDDATPVDYAAALAACTDNELSFLAEQSITLVAVRDEGVAEFGEALYRGVNRERMLRLSRLAEDLAAFDAIVHHLLRGASEPAAHTQNVGSGANLDSVHRILEWSNLAIDNTGAGARAKLCSNTSEPAMIRACFSPVPVAGPTSVSVAGG